VFGKLLDWYIDRRVRQERAAVPPIDWKALHERIRNEVQGYTVFLEMRDGTLVSLDDRQRGDNEIVGLAVTWLYEGVPPPATQEPAEALAKTLGGGHGVEAWVQVSRSIESFVGF
jgi:hypothetical protein